MNCKYHLLILFCCVVFTSCSHLPGQYLNKRDPGFYTQKKDANFKLAVEQSGIKNGVNIGGNYVLTDHLFLGADAGFHKRILATSQFRMQGISFRPVIGYFFDFGIDRAMYAEFHAGTGMQFNSYSFKEYDQDLIHSGNVRPVQLYGGAFIGCRMDGKKIGFDIAYEHNFYNSPIKSYESGEDFNTEIYYFDVHKHSQIINFSTSFYVSKSIRNVDIFFNPGLNIGYTGVFLRLGVVWKL